MRHEKFEAGSIDLRSLDSAQRQALQRRLTAEAHQARSRMIRRTFARVFLLGRRPAVLSEAIRRLVGRAWAAYHRRRERLAELASLRAMTDYELRDIALSRSEIGGIIFSGDGDATSRESRSL